MSDDGQDADKSVAAGHGAEDATPGSRRNLLRLGALGAAAVVTIRPAIAQAATSVITCQVPVPDPGRQGSYIAADGSVVPPGTAGAFPGAPTPLRGQDVKAALNGRSFPGADPQQSRAWTNYIRRLQQGQSGFTCYASLQMPGASLTALPVFRGAPIGTLLRADLDGMVAMYDRRAGVTHVLAEPAVVILDVLGDGEADVPELLVRLGLDDDATPLLTERLDELVSTGLVHREGGRCLSVRSD